MVASPATARPESIRSGAASAASPCRRRRPARVRSRLVSSARTPRRWCTRRTSRAWRSPGPSSRRRPGTRCPRRALPAVRRCRPGTNPSLPGGAPRTRCARRLPHRDRPHGTLPPRPAAAPPPSASRCARRTASPALRSGRPRSGPCPRLAGGTGEPPASFRTCTARDAAVPSRSPLPRCPASRRPRSASRWAARPPPPLPLGRGAAGRCRSLLSRRNSPRARGLP